MPAFALCAQQHGTLSRCNPDYDQTEISAFDSRIQ